MDGTQRLLEAGFQSRFLADYHVKGFPTFCVIDPDGRVADTLYLRPEDPALASGLLAMRGRLRRGARRALTRSGPARERRAGILWSPSRGAYGSSRSSVGDPRPVRIRVGADAAVQARQGLALYLGERSSRYRLRNR